MTKRQKALRRTEQPGRNAVHARSGRICERCGSAAATEWHHRVNRSQGGTWAASNGLDLCGPCHVYVTEHPAESYANGWSVRSTVKPASMPVWRRGEWTWLRDDGAVIPLDLAELAAWAGAA